jgi:hypothetical protein
MLRDVHNRRYNDGATVGSIVVLCSCIVFFVLYNCAGVELGVTIAELCCANGFNKFILNYEFQNL